MSHIRRGCKPSGGSLLSAIRASHKKRLGTARVAFTHNCTQCASPRPCRRLCATCRTPFTHMCIAAANRLQVPQTRRANGARACSPASRWRRKRPGASSGGPTRTWAWTGPPASASPKPAGQAPVFRSGCCRRRWPGNNFAEVELYASTGRHHKDQKAQLDCVGRDGAAPAGRRC